MMFSLFGFDFFREDCLYGIWIGGYKNYEDINRHLFMIYWNNGELLIDMCWIRIYGNS